jgi:serine/threonine protein phosphatase PrpC
VSNSFPFNNMRVRFAGETDIGKTHAENEDSIYLPEMMPLGIVADGMGGAAAGEVASKLTVTIISDFFKKTSEGWHPIWPLHMDPLKYNIFRMESAITLANARVHRQSKDDASCKNMGTTVVTIFFENSYCILSHVGDSRVYRIRKYWLELMLDDHSYVNEIARMRHITREEAAAIGTKTNVVTRVIGPNPQIRPDTTVVYPQEDDLFILCSDGLNDMISDEQIFQIGTETEDLDEMCEKMIAAANEAGGEDNITVIAVRIEKEE